MTLAKTTPINLLNYKTLIFDCDGVILNSNKVKTQAFYQASLTYGKQPAEAMVKYHVQNGGISRYKKFSYFFEMILGISAEPGAMKSILDAYANYVREGLLTCEITLGLGDLRQKFCDSKWLVISGGDQCELREIFQLRGIDIYFDGGIFGSPDSKEVIFDRELKTETINRPCVFLGDSKYDYEVASKFEVDFIFISAWSEFEGWEDLIRDHSLIHKSFIADLI